jgi:hypothetical protein
MNFDQLDQHVIRAICKQLRKEEDLQTLSYLVRVSKRFRDQETNCLKFLQQLKEKLPIQVLVLKRIFVMLEGYPDREIEVNITWKNKPLVTRLMTYMDDYNRQRVDWIKDRRRNLFISNDIIDEDVMGMNEPYRSVLGILQDVNQIKEVVFTSDFDTIFFSINFVSKTYEISQDEELISLIKPIIVGLKQRGFQEQEYSHFADLDIPM